MEVQKRILFNLVWNHLKEKEFIIISGPRQSGKTTLLDQLYVRLKQDSELVFQLTLEDHAILSRLNQHPENLFEFAVRSGRKKYMY
jgi:predicted AAA+ superfamily ATPase